MAHGGYRAAFASPPLEPGAATDMRQEQVEQEEETSCSSSSHRCSSTRSWRRRGSSSSSTCVAAAGEHEPAFFVPYPLRAAAHQRRSPEHPVRSPTLENHAAEAADAPETEETFGRAINSLVGALCWHSMGAVQHVEKDCPGHALFLLGPSGAVLQQQPSTTKRPAQQAVRAHAS